MDATEVTQRSGTIDRTSESFDRGAILARGRAVFRTEAAAITDALDHVGDAFVASVEAVLRCRGRICVTGIGKAGLIGNKIQATLASTGTLAYSLHPVEALHGDLGMIHGDDVVIALSKSGSSEIVELMPRLKALGCVVILLTARMDSLAAAQADHVLNIGRTAEACPLGLAPSSSTAAMLAVGDALALTVMDIRAVQPEQYAGYHPGGALGRVLMKTHEIMRSGADCPIVRETATVAECHQAILSAPHRAGAACVTDTHDKLVGIVTLGDFFRLFTVTRSTTKMSVAEVMTHSPKRVDRDARVTEALAVMQQHAIDELPVVDENDRLVGLIDIQDIVARGFNVCDEA